VIDYKSHPQIHEYLAEHYSSKPFNVIIDIAGADDTLYFESPRYLASEGIFLAGGKMDVTHGGGGFLSVLSFLVVSHLRMHWPRILGGTPRTLVFHSGNVTQVSMQKLPELIRTGQLRGLIDSEWAMEDAIKVRLLPQHPLRETTDKSRLMNVWQHAGQEERSLYVCKRSKNFTRRI
jgi:hypothetical protein